MAGASVKKKLFLKSWDWLLLINAPEGHDKLFDDIELVGDENEGEVPAVLLYVANRGELKKLLPGAGKRLLADATLWIAYPKAKRLGTDLNRDVLWEELKKKGFEGVRLGARDPATASRRAGREALLRDRRFARHPSPQSLCPRRPPQRPLPRGG